MLHICKLFFYLLILLISFSSCSSSSHNSSTQPPDDSAPESEYCLVRNSFQNPISITGNALFYYRPTDLSLGLYGNPLSKGIPYSEVVITDNNGAVIQCGETDSQGKISLTLPKGGAYTLKVQSRGYNNYLKVSVLEEIKKNMPYSISKSFSTNTNDTQDIGNLYAYARQSESSQIEGGAFNILWAIYSANEKMRTISGNSTFVADKVTVFWKAGFNPYSYFGSPDSLVSFYKTGERRLFILGGKSGDVKTQDTDHFDNSVIIHEYAHFLEDAYGRSDSPGGYHDGINHIDARLAWSEGWANFYQSLIFENKYYVDTIGFSGDTAESDGHGGIGIIFNLTENPSTAQFGKVSVSGDGIFQEVSISRSLYKTVKIALIPFHYLWETFIDSSFGFKSASFHFRSVGLYNNLLEQTLSRASFPQGDPSTVGTISYWKNNIITSEKQSTTTKFYGDPLVQNSNSCASITSISPARDIILEQDRNGALITISDKVRSNRFYQYYHDGSDYNLQLSYTNASAQNPALRTIDLDLYVYNESHSIIEDYYLNAGESNTTIAGQSKRLNPSIENGYESVSMNGKPAGWYLINIKANTYNKISSELNGTATFTLSTSSGRNLCPENN